MGTIIRTPTVVGFRGFGEPKAQVPHTPAELRSPERPQLDVDAIRKEIEDGLRAELSAESQRQFESATKRGYEEGHKQGRAEAERALLERAAQAKETQLRELRQALGEFHEAIDAHIADMEGRLVGLLETCLCQLLGSVIVEPEAILSIVKHVLQAASAADKIRVRLHPEDLASLQARYDLADLVRGDQAIEFLADAGLTGGGCVAETSIGQFDASIDMQLRNLHTVLHQVRSARQA